MRGLLRVVGVCLCMVAASACSLKAGQRGDTCERSAQCAEGLACVQHECSNNLQMIADESTVPDFGGADASFDGSMPVDASIVGTDSAVVVPGMDATVSTTPDTGTNMPPVTPDPDDDAG